MLDIILLDTHVMNSDALDNNPDSGHENQEATQRRPVSYHTFTALIEDAEFLAAHPHQTVGNWSYGKILQHLANSFNRSLDGFGYKAPFFVRIVAGMFLKKKYLQEGVPPGFKLPKAQEAKLPSDETPVATALDNLKQAIARFEREEPRAAHPAFGDLTPDEWSMLHLRHSELHMSFVKPA